MDAFIGTINAKTDAKGRVFVPATFRKILQSLGESHLVLRKDIYQSCLILYPETVWKEELNRLRKRLNEDDDVEQNIYRQIVRFVEPLDLDASGRILIPKMYLQLANISHEICFLGMNQSIELWDPDKLTESMLSPEDLRKNVKQLLGSKPAIEI